MVQKFQYIKKKVWVGTPNGFLRYDPRIGKKVHVNPYQRDQNIKVATSDLVLKLQKAEGDWSHRSYEYPNILGLSDKEIYDYIKNTKEDKEIVKEYIKHIRCYDKNDIREVSKKAFKKFEDNMLKEFKYPSQSKGKDPYHKDSTIFITSPRGGFNILGDFGYANKLDKKNFPYDLDKYGYTIKAESLPYGASISDVNDIVFIDDIYMSGEQCGKAYYELKKKIQELDTSKEQQPRLHYMAMVGNKHAIQQETAEWDSIIVGEEYNFRRSGKNFEEVSAVIFPFSIPDGDRHHTARRLYRTKKRFAHRTD